MACKRDLPAGAGGLCCGESPVPVSPVAPTLPLTPTAEHTYPGTVPTGKQRTPIAQCLEAHTRRASTTANSTRRNNHISFIDPGRYHDGLIPSFLHRQWNPQRQKGARHPPPSPYPSSPPRLQILHHHNKRNKHSQQSRLLRDPPRGPRSRLPPGLASLGTTPRSCPTDERPRPSGPKTYPHRDQPAAPKMPT